MRFRERDTQRSKLYHAESVLPSGRRFQSVPEMQAAVNQLTRRAWWIRRRWPRAIEVRDGRGRRSACAIGSWAICMPRSMRTEDVLLHELAHCCTSRIHGGNVPAHGREFATILLELVRLTMGREVAKKLKASYRESHVKSGKKRAGGRGNPEALRRWREQQAAAQPVEAA